MVDWNDRSPSPARVQLQLLSVTSADVVSIRDLVVRDPVALDKWPTIIDHIVISAADKYKVKRGLRKTDPDLEGVVLRSLQIWHGYGSDRADLVAVLWEHGLKALAGKLRAPDVRIC